MPIASVNGVDLCYRVQGKGAPLLLIMGLGGPQQSWFFQVRAFQRHYQVITFDNRGVGRTDDRGEPFTVRTMAEDAVALLDHLSIERAHVLGYSLGGIVAQMVAAVHPERVKKLILVSTTPVGLGRDEATPEMLATLGREEGATETDPAEIPLENLMPQVVDLAFRKRGYRLLLRPMVRLFFAPSMLAGLRRQLAAVSAASTYDLLHLIQASTLVLTGTEDRVVSPEGSITLAQRISNARLVLVEGGSHGFAIEISGRFNREVLAFLGSH